MFINFCDFAKITQFQKKLKFSSVHVSARVFLLVFAFHSTCKSIFKLFVFHSLRLNIEKGRKKRLYCRTVMCFISFFFFFLSFVRLLRSLCVASVFLFAVFFILLMLTVFFCVRFLRCVTCFA